MRRWSSGLAVCGLVLYTFGLAGCGSSSSPSGPSNSLTGPFVVAFGAASANPGDTVRFTITLPGGIPAQAPLVLTLAVNGQRGPSDTTLVPAYYDAPPVTNVLTGTVALPDGFPDGTLTLIVSLPQQRDSTSAALAVRDTRSPSVAGAVTSIGLPFSVQMTFGMPMLIAGVTDTLTINAADNGALGWVGYALGAPANIRDSVSGQNALSGVLTVPVPIPTTWVGGTPAITVFAYDRDGNYTEQDMGKTAVASHITRPVRTVSIDTSVRRAVYDTKRQVVYLAVGDQSAVQVLSLTSMTYGAPLSLPLPAADLDLRPGGDSLVVALANTADLAIVNLAAASGSPSVVHFASLDGPNGDTTNVVDTVKTVRVPSDGRVLVAVSAGNTSMHYLVQLHPATMSDTVVFSWQNGGAPAFVRTGNGAKVLILYGPGGDLLYDARSQSYAGVLFPEPTQNAPATWLGGLSADSDGSYYSLGDQLLNATSTDLGTVDISVRRDSVQSLVSPSGGQYFVEGPGSSYMRFLEPNPLNGTLSTVVGQPVDVVDTPEPIRQFVSLADSTSLLAFGADKAMLFDLTQSSPAPSRAVRPPSAATRRVRWPVEPAPSALVLHVHLGHVDHTFTLPRVSTTSAAP